MMRLCGNKKTYENQKYGSILSKLQVLASMWSNRNPLTLLMGMQTGAATVKSSMELPQKIKNKNAV